LEEPRTTFRGNLRHMLLDMIFLVISAVISGANNWKEIEVFGKSQIRWLQKFVPLENGIPSHDTLGRVFSILDHESFSQCFMKWIQTISRLTDGEVVAIDGKRLCGSSDKVKGIKAVHMVSAFASENGLCLGQTTCDEKSNEITAIPELLEILSIKGCTVTIDAMGCQSEIAKKIVQKEAGYILAVKENQKELHEQVVKMFEIKKTQSIDIDIDSGHGRVETRKCEIVSDLAFFDVEKEWTGLKTLVKIESERFIQIENKTQREIRYYISSLQVDAKTMNNKIREHWRIENKLHWILDVNFGEDSSSRRIGNSAKNFNLVSKIAMSLLSKENSEKNSMAIKRYKAALNPDYREKVLKI
jgi:predicted transposase YbfD/YdcC